jgi:hypothetical protein
MKQSAFTKDRFSFARALSLLLLISVLLPTLSFAQGQYTRFEPESGSVTKFQTGTGTVETQGKSEWSAGQQLWWRDAKIGQSLELTLQVPAPGFYRVVTGLTKAFDYGIFDFTVDGKVALRNVDFYSPNEKLPTPLTLAEATFLDAGPVKIVATVRGANPLAVKRYMLGWDYIDLVPVAQPVERSLTVEAGSVPVELNLSQQNPAPVDWVQPIVWQLSEQRPDWANISPSGVLTLAPPISAMDSQKSSPIFAVARDSSNPQKSQSFLLTLQVKQPSIPSENELVFSETISVTPSQTSSPVSVTNLVSQNPSLNGGQATLYATSSNGQFQIALQDGQLTVSAIPHAVPGTYAVFVAIADPQNPASKKIGRLVVRVQPPSITKPDIALSKTIVRGDSNQESGTLNLSNSLGAIGESLVSPLTFEKLPDAVGYSEGISVVANGSSVSFTAIENQAAPESTNTPFYFLVTDNSVPKRKVSVLVNLTVQQPSVPQDAPPTDRFSLPIPVLMGAQSQPINLEASLPQTLNLSAAKAFSLLRNPHQAKISANLSPSGDLSLAPLPAASPGNYPITIKVVDGLRVVYGTLEIQLTAPSIPPTDFDVTAQAVIGQTMPVNINLASKTPPGFSPQSAWTVVSNPSASSAEIYVGQSNLSITPRTNAAPGEYLAYLKVTDTTQGQPVEKFAKLRILLAPATPAKVDFFIAQEVIIGSPSLPKNLAPLLPQTLGLQEPLTFTTYSSTAPIGSLSASLSPNGALMLSSYQSQTNTVTTGTYAVYVAVTDSASKTVFGQISVQLATPTPLAIDAETAVYHDLATPPQPIDLGARLQQAAEGLPLEGIFYEIYADNAPGYSKKLDPSGFLAVAPSNPLQPGSQSLIVRASSPSVGVRFLKIWLHAVGAPSEVQPTLETRILASKVGASPLVSLVPASQPNVPSQPSPTQNSFWSVEVLENPLANAWQFKTTEDGKITVSMVSDAPPVSAYATVRLKSLDPTNSVQSIARVLIDPRDFATANLLGHYDALRNDSLVRNGDLVGQWKDLSGNNHHLFAGPEGGPKTSLLSGLQTIDFYPEKGLVAQGVPLSESVTVFIVLKPSPEIRTWGSYIHHGHHDEDWAIRMNGNPGSKTGFHSSNDNDIVQEHLIPDLSYVLVGRLETTLGSNTDRRTFKIFRSDGTQTTVASSTLSKSITPGLKPLFIGKSDSGEASNGKVGEILYYSSALSDGEVSANASYLISKWMGTPLPSGGGQTGGETPTTTTQLPAQTLFNTLGASLDLNSLVPASVSLTQPFIWTMGNTPLPEGVFLSPSGELIINPLPGQTQSATSFTLAVSVTEALNPQKSASLLIPVTLEPFSEETALSATSTSPIQVTLGGVNAPVDLRPILSTAAQSIPNVDIDWNTAQLSIALTRGNGAFTARLLSGSTLSVDSLPNALPGAYDIFVKATSNSATAATKLFRVPVFVSGPTQSNVDLVLARNIVRGVPTQVDISTQVLSPLGISTSAGLEVINAANLSGGIIVSSTQDESLEITAGPSTDGISKESIFLKVSADTPKGIVEKFVRVDCTVSAFSIPSTSETFSAEITVAGVPNQESVYPLGQIIPANLLSDSTFKYRILDPSILAVKGAEALLNPESLIVKPLNDFLPGKTQLVLEAKGALRTVYGTLTVVQSPFAAPPTTFELSVQSPVGGKLKYPINLAVQMDPSLATAGQPSGVTPSPFLLDVVYNASKRGVFASLQGTSLTSLDVSQTAYLGKNVVYLRRTDTTTGATTFGKLLVNVVPSAPEQIWQQISTSVPWQPTGVSVDVRPLLESSLANRSDLEFSLYSVENTNGLNPNVAPDGVIQLQGSPAGFASNTKPITLHLSVREIATGLIRYVTLNVSVQDTEEPSTGFPAVVYVDINLPTSIVDIHQALGLTTPPEETSIQITRISNPEEISVKTFGRYALIKPSSIAQPGIYSLQVSVPDEEFADPSLTGGTRELLICAFGEAIGSSTQAPYLATADWDSPQSLTLASSSGTISLKIAANQAQNFLRAELNGGSVKFYADRSHAIPGTFKVKVTDPRSPQVQLYVNVSVPADIFRPVPTIDFIAKREFLQGQPTTVDLRSLFPGLNPSMQYTFSIPSSLEGNPLRATITPTGILTLPGFQGQAEPSGSDFSVVRMGMSWNQAKEDAFKRGGHLATFSSATEWMSMLQQVGQADGLWIGASDQLNEGKWEWVTGEAWTYQNWAGGEPNNCCGGEHFLMVSGSVWNDASGSFASGYILETPVSAVYLKATDSTGSSVMLRLDVALRAPQSQIDVEVPVNVVNQSVDLNSLTGPIGDIGPNRVWELESKSVPSLSLSPSGQITLGASPIEGHATLTARVRDLISNKSVFVTVSVRTAKPQTLEILQNPISQTVNTGSRVLLAVSAESPLRDSSQLAYQWRRNGTPIPGAVFDAYTFTVTNDSKGEYDVLISDGASQKASGKALIATDDTVFAGSLSSAIQSVVQSGTAVTLQQQSPGFRIRQVVLKPSATLGSVNTLAAADLILSLPSNDSRIASTYLLSSPTLNHYGDGDSGHYPGKTRLPVSEPSYALRAEATLFIPTEGVYTFGVNSDDGSRITIDGVPVMVDDSIHGAQDFLSQPITLTSGLHSVEITMFDGGYGDHIEFFAAPGAHSSWNNQFSLVGSTQGLKVYYTPISTTATSTQTTQSGLPVGETVWFDEGWMLGMQGNAGEIAVGSASQPASSGSLMFRLQGYRNDVVVFPSPWKPSSQNGFIFFDMFIPQESDSLAFMLQVGSREGWEHRAVWGAMDQAPGWGTPDTNSRRKVGELPPKGKWTRMQLPLSSLGITSADYVRELAFSQLNGLVFIDKVGFADLPPYQWYKDGVAISGANSQTLKLSSSQSSDSGIYSLRVTNSGTSIFTSSVFLYVREAVWDPSEIMHPLLAPAPAQFQLGSTLRLAALVSGPLDVRYEWRKNGVIVPGTTSELTIANASESDAGTYSVAAISDSTLRMVEFAPVQVSTLIPVQKPIFPTTSAPRSLQIPVGTPLNLTDSATGSNVTYSWTKNGQSLQGFQTNSLFIPLVSPSDAGQYALVATNSAGSAVSAPFSVVIEVPPTFSESGQPKPASVIEGDPFQIIGNAVGASSYQWYLNGTELTGATSNSYLVLKASLGNAGTYKLVATSPFGLTAESQSVKVDVFSRPSIRLQPQHRFVALGEQAVFSVEATGSGPLSFKWFRNGTVITESNLSTFVIPAAAETDAALYSVEVSSPYGTVLSTGAQLAIKPTITAAGQPRGRVIRLGDSFSLSVQAVGTGALTYQWFKNGVIIPAAIDKTFSVAQSSVSSEGQYHVEVRSDYGSTTSQPIHVLFKLQIVSQPSSVTSNTGSPVLFSVNATSSFGPVKYQWRRNSRPIPGAIFSVFGIESASTAAQGLYDVVVSDNSTDVLTSTAANLSVSDAFKATLLSNTPHSVQRTGEVTNLSVDAPTNATIQWRRDGFTLAETSRNLSVNALGLYDAVVSSAGERIMTRQFLVAPGDTAPAIPGITVRQVRSRSGVGSLAQAEALLNLPSGHQDIVAEKTIVVPQLNLFGEGADGHYGNNLPLPLSGEPYAIRANGTILVSEAGIYTFGLNSDDGGTIRIDGKPVMIDDSNHGPIDNLSQGVELSAGTHSIEVIMWEGGGGDEVELFAAKGIHFAWNENFRLIGAEGGISVTTNGVGASTRTPDFVRFLRIPVTFDAFVGQPISVSAYAISSSPSPVQYRWQKNGDLLTGVSASILFQSKLAQVDDSGLFRLTAAAGDILSSPVDFTVSVSDTPTPPQVVDGLPTTLAPTEGTQLLLSPKVIGSAPLMFEWFKDGKLLNAKTPEFARTSVTRSDEGSYSLKVSNAFGETTIGPVLVSVMSSPIRIVGSPKSLRVGIGSPATFTVEATGSEALQYQWSKNGVAISGQTNPQLQIPKVDFDSAGTYEVRVSYPSNSGSAVTAMANLTVEPLPQVSSIRIQPTPNIASGTARLRENSVVTLSVTASGSGPFKYLWSRSGVVLGDNAPDLVTKPLTGADTGAYSVRVETPFGAVTSEPLQIRVVAAPKIAKQPKLVSAREASPLSVAVEAQSTEPITYQWRKDTVVLGNETSAVFRRNVSTPTDSGVYTVTVSDGLSEVVSEPIQVSILPEFEIKTHPSNAAATSGQDVEFFVATDSVAPLRYQWLKNGSEIPGAIAASLRLKGVTTAEEGVYSVRISSSITPRQVESNPARLVVDAPLAFIRDLDSEERTLAINGAATFEVQVSGSGTIRYKWEVSDDKGPWMTQTASGPKLSLPGLPKEGSRQVRVTATNGTSPSIVSKTAALTFADVPAIVAWSSPQTTRVGARAEMSVSASGAGVQIVWTKGNLTIAPSRVETVSGISKSTVSIAQVSTSDAGTYVATVTSPRSTSPLTRSFELVVNESPFQITKQPVNTVIREGQSGRLSLGFESGTSDLSFQWKKSGIPLQGQTSPVLNLFKAKLSDEGTYSVEVSSKLLVSPVESDPATISIETPPRITQQPESLFVSVRETNSTNLEVTAKGSVDLAYQWFSAKTATGASRQLVNGANASRLELKNVSPEQSGFYWVEVSNSLGVVSSDRVRLEVTPALNLTSLPKSADIAVGGTATLSVSAESLTPETLRFQWYKLAAPQGPVASSESTTVPNGAKAIPGAEKASLLIESVAEEDTAEYIVEVVDSSARKVARGAIIRAISPASAESIQFSARAETSVEPVTIPLTGDEIIVGTGNRIDVRLNVLGSLPATVSVQLDGQVLATTLATTSTPSLEFRALKQHQGTLKVLVSNLAGTWESSAMRLSTSDSVKILAQPQSLTADAQSRVELSLKAIGVGKLTYRWSRNGTLLTETQSPRLLIPRVSGADAGIYQVRVSDGFTNELSSGAILELRNVILIQPLPVSVKVGQSARLRVELSSDDYEVYWLKSGTPIEGATSKTLDFPSVRASDFSVYQAVITHRTTREEIKSSEVAVTELPDLSNLNLEGTAQVKTGNALTLSVPAQYTSSLPGATYQWLRNFQPIPGASGSSLDFTRSAIGDSGVYTVRITTPQGISMSKPFTVAVVEPDLLFSSTDVQATSTYPASVNLLSFDKASVGFVSFELAPHSNRINASLAGQSTLRLTVPTGLVGVTESFDVRVFGAGGLYLGRGRITVSVPAGAPPMIAQHPVSTGIPKDGSTVLSVQASGGSLRYQWRFNETNIAGANTSVLAARAAAGRYDCVVTNEAGSVVSAPATVFEVEAPLFTVQPASVKGIAVGSSASLWVALTSTYPVSFQWFKDGVALSGQTSRVLNIVGFTPADEGSYYVTATNKFGVFSQSEPAALSLDDSAIRIIAQPQSQAVLANTPVILQVVAKGPQLSYEWFKDGVALSGQTSRVLEIQISESATYFCRVSSPSATSVQSVPATVRIIQSKFSLIESKLVSKTLSVMDSLSLGISVEGEGSFLYQWMKNGAPLEGEAARKDTFVIAQVKESDAGSYSVRVTRGSESIDSTQQALVTVAPPLVFLTQPSLLTEDAYAGQDPILLEARASDPTSRYQWRKNGIDIPNEKSNQLSIKPKAASDSGTYDVIASTFQGTRMTGRIASQSVFIRVIDALKITAQPKSVVANPGDGLALEVSTEGGSPSFEWFFKKSGATAPTLLENQTLSRLEIPSASSNDEGSYYAVIKSPKQNALTTIAATVKINKPVTITRNISPTPVTLAQGKSLTLQVAASGTLPIRYQWRKDGVPINGATNQRLIITNSKAATSATYDCVVSNVVGPVTSEAALVTMAGRLEIASHPTSLTVLNPGETFTAAITLSNPSGSEKVQWYRTLGKTTRAVTGATSLSLTIPEVKEEDDAAYFAVVSGQVRLTSKLASLRVNKPVRFVSQPAPEIALVENKDLVLSVSVSGTSTKEYPIAFQWSYNGQDIPSARSQSLIIKNAKVSASGVYSVTVTNIAGKAKSQDIRVTVAPGASFGPIYAIVNGTRRSPQSVITENPSSTSAPVKFKLATDVTAGDFVVGYRWRVNGRSILAPSAETAVLDFDSLGNAEAGSYDVVITTKTKQGIIVEEVTLEAVNVVVNEPIVVTVPPVSQGTNSGSQIELRAGAKGTGLAYQWMRLNPATQVYEPISGATAPTLTLTVNEQTQGKYRLALNGTVNQVSLSEINVWLLDSIRIEKQPENLSVIAGETATLSVDARSTDDTPRNLSYRWRKNRATSGLVDGKVTSVDVVQRGSGYRQAPSVELVTTGQGTGAKAEAVMELDASGETFSVARIVVTNGGSGYDSAPEVRIVGEITPNQQGTIGRQAVAGIFAAPAQQSSPDLTLTTVSEADEGEYYVEVFDGPVDDAAPRLTSSVVNLTVRGKAKIEMQPTLLTALEGQPFDIQLVASGNEAVFQWTKTTGSGANSTSSVITTDGPKIEFASLSETDSGTYTLNVSTANPPGTATSREIVLQVIALPKELSQPEPLIEKNPLESFYIQPEISVAPQGQTFFYQWFKNDREIVGAVGRTLFINQAAEADEGRYRLEVYSQAGILKASPVDLSVNDVPRVIAAPENQTVEPGESFSLAVSALGKGLSYQWFLNGVSIPDATSSILTVDQAVNGETEGNYSVVITSSTKYGGVGEPLQTSAKAIIVVKDPTSIVKQPAAEEVSGVNLNASRTWTVEARGTNLSYQWQKNGTDILGATQKTYRVGSAQLSDEGVYRVVVSGDLGTLQSTDFILEINKAPAFVTQPTSVSAIAGGVVEVQADVTGSAPLRFQWRKEGRALAGQTASQLRLSGASTTDAGSYDVVVSNPVGTIRSAPFRVTIATPPQIVRDPASLVVIPGESPSLFVSASGAGPLSYQWFKDGEPLDGENASELRLPPVSMESDGRYSVSVSNAAGSVFSQTAKVTVLSPVVITTQPTDARVLLKARASLSVEVSDASLPVSYQWRKGGIPISAATSKTFTIASAQNSDSGEYDVVITNDAGSVTSAQALIIIDSAMSARPLPEKLAVNQGSGTSISVTPIGAGPFTYQWRKNGQNVVGATEDVLVFEFASVTDSGSYDVVISNPSSSVTSSKTELKVEARINITKQPESVIAAVNDSVSLSVQATASGALSYQWRRNGINITASNQPTLTLKASAETSGVYDVVISETAADQSVYSILSAGAALDLSSPVRILSKPQSLSVFQGDGAAFDVVATGTGNLTYSWSLAGKLIPNEIGHRLIIPQVTSKPPSTLTYSVTVSDGKTSETATATLTVRARPSNQSQTTAQPTGQDSSANLSLSAQVRSYLIEARAVAGAAPFEGRLYLDAETESAVISELSETLSNSFRAPEAGVTLTPALTAGELEVLKLEFRSNSGLESWSLQGPANLVASQADGSWMAHTLVGLRKVYDTTGKLIGTWMVSVQFQESVPALPPAISGASSSQ